MLPEVLGQVTLLGEGFVTLVSFVRLFSQMHTDVIFEIPLLVKVPSTAWDHAVDFLYLTAGLGVDDVPDFVRVKFEQELIPLAMLGHI